ncbi:MULTISPECIES: ATP-binding protein [unclassified Acidisoma]|jgi:two-component system osmolarity sensor histidine kinase EnvZ|uniref:ATP-binding protein n=1 Tax=unclassified Acidisoma TaxID=2634065 RepID=UPI00131A9B63|nr:MULTISPECIES: ATP-binding protein [unclassified Acidisoma]
MKTPEHVLRKFLPRSLFGRSLLIIVLPVLLLEAVTLQLFYGGHLGLISRRFAFSIASEIAFSLDMIAHAQDTRAQQRIIAEAQHQLDLRMSFEPGKKLVMRHQINILGPMDDDLAAALHQHVSRPFDMDWTSDPQSVLVRIGLPVGVVNVTVPRKRLDAGSIYVFVLWIFGTSILLLLIAGLFMRNQVRGIRRLARAAETFGMGRDRGPIRPEGAREVRQAAAAFNRMQDRILRFLSQRTDMLAGVSHDLRTPLTRLRLALAMLPKTEELAPEVADMTADVEEMERMIAGYLAFARGEGEERAEPANLSAMLEEVVAAARRADGRVTFHGTPDLTLPLRADAMRRAVNNLVDNARRHARHVVVGVAQHGARAAQITVDDDGPGIPPERRESVFRPFESGASPGSPGGGTGLGLAIARDIVRAHGGEILLGDSPLGGLRATIRLPL